ncbi:MAG: cardiolipin synthase [Prevotellaceae bacterium]|nr:cardiolipin synthase [Prevotellaceae bacterium]
MMKRAFLCFAMFVSVIILDAQTSDSIMANHLRERGLNISDGNSVRLLTTGHDKFEDMFDAIREAKSFIHLEYFNFRNDSIASLLFHLLVQKAKEGVEVRALYDAFGNASNNKPIKSAMHDSIRALGIDLVKFSPLTFPWVNRIIPRDHRKIVVIDGKIAYTGGMNVADYYIDGIPEIGDWHDMHMRVEGEAVNDLHEIFCKMWYKSTGEYLMGEKYFPQHPTNVADASSTNISASDRQITHCNQRISIVDRDPKYTADAIRDLFSEMLNTAQHKVLIINPYFVPTHRVRKALKKAVDRGVDVQILLSAKSDIPLTPEASHYVGNNLAKRGAKVYLYHGGFHHTKIMMVDDLYCTVGSSNMDSRSLRCDYEVNTVIFSKDVTAELTDLFNEQLKSSTIMEKGYWGTRSLGKRFQGWFGNLLTPFL